MHYRLLRSRGRALGTWLILAVVLGYSFAWAGTGLDTRPIPRVETGTHIGYIYKLASEPAGKQLLSVADDKTARLWDAQTGRLLQTLRVPIGYGHEGQLYAAALSPNGKVAAVGGYTGSFSGQSIVYFFDTQSGRRLSQQSMFSDKAVENIAFSGDGTVLAVCLADGAGVRLFSLLSRTLLKREDRIQDKILGAAFAPNGDFAITTLDGYLYVFRAASGYESVSTRLSGGKRPMHVQFSPDGAHMVVGFDGDPSFSIVDAVTQEEEFSRMLPANAQQDGLHVVEWSSDGEYVYAGGETLAGLDTPIYRFGARGHGQPELMLSSTRRISDLRRLPHGAMAFTSGEPDIGVFESSGSVRWRHRAPSLDARRMEAAFRVSPTGNEVDFGGVDGTGGFHFDVAAQPQSALKPSETATDQHPHAAPSGWSILLSEDKERLSVNGSDAQLEMREAVLNWTFTADGGGLIVGTSWSLRRYDRLGRMSWASPLTASVNLSMVSDDGRSIVAILSDGTIRWFRPEDGVEFLALFVTGGGHDWIAWTPSGYYMSSAAGDNFIGWQINRGVDQDPDFYRAVQFERILYRPDLVQTYFTSRGQIPTQADPTVSGGFDIGNLDAISPPQLDVAVIPNAAKDNPSFSTVRVSGKSHGLPMQDWSLFINGIPELAGQPLRGAEQIVFSKDIHVRLPAGLNHLQVESIVESPAGRAMGMAEQYVSTLAGASASRGGILYLVAIGVDSFMDPMISKLQYAGNDAAEVVSTFEHLYKPAGYVSIRTKLLGYPDATSTAIASTLRSVLAKANGNDGVIIFLASHGFSDRLGNYFFVPVDAKQSDIDRLDAKPGNAPSLVRWDVIVDELRRTAGRRLLIVDTCSSGRSSGNFDAHSLAKRSISSNFAMMAAAGSYEKSQELSTARHGLFTYGLLRALTTGYDPDHDGKVSLSEAFHFAFDTVQEMRAKGFAPQTPQLNAPDALSNMVLAPGQSTASR